MIIDKLAYNSKLRNIAPISKLLFSMSVLVICIWANSFLVSVFTALTMLFLIIFIGKTSYKNVFHLMTVPIVFIIMGSAAIAISIGQNSSDMLFSLHFGNTYFGVSHTSLLSAVRVMIKCFGAVSCMYFTYHAYGRFIHFAQKKHYTEFYNRNCGTDLQIHFCAV